MGRILAIDYGRKRVGLAVSDALQLIAGGLDTVASQDIFDYLKEYTTRETVEVIVVGHAKKVDNTDSESMVYIKPFVKKLRKLFPEIPVETLDERFTSVMAKRAIIDAGARKKTRQNKALVDKVSATILLQNFMQIYSGRH